MIYKPVSCDFYDHLETLALRKSKVKIVFVTDGKEKVAEGIIENLFSKENAEYLKIQNNQVRLDNIKTLSLL